MPRHPFVAGDPELPMGFAAGIVVFGVLFTFYAVSLKTAELSLVTLGWVVFLQVGLVLCERFRYGANLPAGKWAAIALILALQAYLVLMPNDSGSSDVAGEPAIDQAAGSIATVD